MKYVLPAPKHQEFLDSYIHLIENASFIEGCNVELHHILPLSMGGSNDKANLIYLSTEQHYEAHYLLWRAYRNRQMSSAFHLMTTNKVYHGRITANEFAHLREDYKIAKKEYWNNLSVKEREIHKQKSNPWANKSDVEKEEYKKKLSDQTKQNSKQKWTEQRRLEHSIRMKKCVKTLTPDITLARIQSYKNTVKNRTNEDRAKLNYGNGGARKGTVWVNNGLISKRYMPNEIPIGWAKGRLKK